MPNAIQTCLRRARALATITCAGCAVAAPDPKDDDFFNSQAEANDAAAEALDAATADGAAATGGPGAAGHGMEPTAGGLGQLPSGDAGNFTPPGLGGAGAVRDAQAPMARPDASATASDASACDPATCTNMCLLSTSVHCCTRLGTCGCGSAPDSLFCL